MKIKKDKRILIKDKLLMEDDKEIIKVWPAKCSMSIQKYFKTKYKTGKPL
jgi:hypothetical protein